MNDLKGLREQIEALSLIVGASNVTRESQDLKQYGSDWCSDFEANPSLAVFPSNFAQLEQVVSYCFENKLAIVPSGGRTGLSAGATATRGEIVLSLQKMNRIIDFNVLDRTVRCEAGVVTQKLQEEALSHGLYFPVDFASKGSSTIGGNVATNAGGIHVIRYGNIRPWVIGLKAVTGTGDVLDLSRPLIKDQTGLDLKSLLIGSEGILAVIGEVTLRLTSQPGETQRILCGLPRLEALGELFAAVRARFNLLNMFEFMSRSGVEKVIRQHKLKEPFESTVPYYALIEVELAVNSSIEDISEFFIEMYSDQLISEVVVAQSSQQSQQLLAYRELITESMAAKYHVHKNDISVPVHRISDFVAKLESMHLEHFDEIELVVFGHAGDGNLHIGLLAEQNVEKQRFLQRAAEIDSLIFELVGELDGSISAEHGVGLLKKPYLKFTRAENEINLMRSIKRVFDPGNILNPGKVFDL